MPTLAHEARVVGRLSLPMVVGNVAMYGMGFVDTLVVGPLGKDALAGVSMANNWAFACTVLGLGALRVVDPVVSQAHGAGDTRSVGRALNNAIGLALALSVPMWLLLATTAWVLPALGQAPALVPFAARYCAILALGVPGSFAFAALRQVLQGMGIVREATWVLLGANVLNLALVWGLVYGLGWGPLGCAAATATCQTASFFALRRLARAHIAALAPEGLLHGVSVGTVRQLLREGLPLGVQMGMEAWAFTTSGLMVGWLGPTAMAAHSITLTLASLAFMVPLGISGAGATRVGNLVGADRPWGRAASAALLLGCGVMTAFAVTFGGFAREVASLWQPEPEVLTLCAVLLPIAATFSLFDGIQVVSFGILRGAGDLRVPSLANLLAYWCLGLPLGAWLAFREGMGAVGIWTGLAVGLCTVGMLLLARVAHIARRGARRVALGG
jgi:MATE family multidrug resistance protein